jgi:hypothetical protein
MHSDSSVPLPPDERQEWITKTANQLRDALANPQVRTRVVELLNGDAQGRGSDDETD